MITQTREELDAAFKSAVDQYFQLQRNYEFLKAQRDRLSARCDKLQEENDDLKKLIGVYV
jgi:FtsZ-binding cell division protein ZapB